MNIIPYAMAALALAAVPAKAETAFWFTCDFPAEPDQTIISFGLYASSGEGFLTFDPEDEARPIVWMETGDTVHIFAKDQVPQTWLISFNSEELQGISFAYGQDEPSLSTSCRGGAE